MQIFTIKSILNIVNQKKQAVFAEQVSYLHIVPLQKIANALNKLPLKLLLSYQGLSTFQLYIISYVAENGRN